MTLRIARSAWPLALFLGAVFLFGGASRADAFSNVPVRVLAVASLTYATLRGRWWNDRGIRVPLGVVVASIGLCAAQLIPLPPAVWAGLPGRALLVEVADVAGIAADWRPLTMVPWGTWNALSSLLVPLAALALAGMMKGRDREQILPVIVALAALSAVIGGLQLIGPERGAFYFYKITNFGSAVGLFANRNHQALLMAMTFPMLAAVSAREGSGLRNAACLSLGVFFAVSVVVTGSRAGAALALVGVVAAVVIAYLSNAQFERFVRARWKILAVLGVGAAIGLMMLGTRMSRLLSLSRLADDDAAGDLRFRVWPEIVRMIDEYFPFGTGMGSFVEVYGVGEPTELVTPKYLNHAHNDWLELLLTGGVAGGLIAGIAVLAWGFGSWRAWRGLFSRSKGAAVACCASVQLLMLGMHSTVDYSGRTATMMVLAVLAGWWLMDVRVSETISNGAKARTDRR